MKEQRTLLSGLLTVKGGRALINVGLNLYRLVQAKAPSKSNVRVIKHFTLEVFKLAKHNSNDFVIKYLKTCAILLQQYVAGHTERHNSRAIGDVAVAVTRAGLPRIIPKLQRVLIRRGNVPVITLWLSLFNLYRYLQCSYKSKDHFKTVTQKSDGNFAKIQNDAAWGGLQHFIPVFWRSLTRLLGKLPDSNLKVTLPQIMQSVSLSVTERMGLKGSSLFAAMNAIHVYRWIAMLKLAGSQSILSRFLDKWGISKRTYWGYTKKLDSLVVLAEAWWPMLNSVLRGPVNRSLHLMDGGVLRMPSGTSLLNTRAYLGYLKAPNMELVTVMERVIARLSMLIFNKREQYIPSTGRLVKLYEAAGKVRIIAIVDPIMNWLLKPLHDWVFAILRQIPQDGTFDQDRPINALVARVKKLDARTRFIGSCDMSAATDRLPVALQAMILGRIFGPKLANAWMNLLVSTPYSHKFKSYAYAVGQPMGALSSWAMLALTHHFLWQWAAFRAGVIMPGMWFKSYAVLGDDSAAGVHRVVKEYLVICSEIGVKVNLAKSLLSPKGCLEFAKRFITPFGNCSPVSIGEILVAKRNFATMSNLPRKFDIRIADLLSIMGYRFRVIGSIEKSFLGLPKKARNMLIVLLSPWGAIPSPNLIDWLALNGYNRSKVDKVSMDNLSINLLVYIDKLRIKIIKIVDSNNTSYRMSGVGGDERRETLTQQIRETDPQTFRILMDLTLEPFRKDLFFKMINLLIKVKKVQEDWSRRVFFADRDEINSMWEELMLLEKEFHSYFGGDVYLQAVEKPFVEPSPMQVIRLRNRLCSSPSYTSVNPLMSSQEWEGIRKQKAREYELSRFGKTLESTPATPIATNPLKSLRMTPENIAKLFNMGSSPDEPLFLDALASTTELCIVSEPGPGRIPVQKVKDMIKKLMGDRFKY